MTRRGTAELELNLTKGVCLLQGTFEKRGRRILWLERGGATCGSNPMQDWLLVIAPLATVVYFVKYPDQFADVVSWLSRWIQ